MKAAELLISLIVLAVALPAQAKDSDNLGSWSLEDLCQKKDKPKHAEAIVAELGRREVFSPLDLELVQAGRIDIGMDEAALQCSWGEPDTVSQWDSDSWQTYRPQIAGQQRRVFVRVIAGQVTEIYVRPVGYNVGSDSASVYAILHSDRLLSGRDPTAPAGTSPCVVNCLRPNRVADLPPANEP